MTNAAELKRVFKMGSIALPDPDPSMPPEEVLKAYAVNYCHLGTATVEGPNMSDDGKSLEYEFVPLPAKTKG